MSDGPRLRRNRRVQLHRKLLDVRRELIRVRRVSVQEKNSPRAALDRVEVKRRETYAVAIDVHLDEAGGRGGTERTCPDSLL